MESEERQGDVMSVGVGECVKKRREGVKERRKKRGKVDRLEKERIITSRRPPVARSGSDSFLFSFFFSSPVKNRRMEQDGKGSWMGTGGVWRRRRGIEREGSVSELSD